MPANNLSETIKSLEDAPFAKLLGLRIESAADGEARVRMPHDAHLLNSGGPDVPVHGGAIAALADVAACAAVWTLPVTVSSATISMTVNYTGSGRSDLLAHARVRRCGKRIASLNVEIVNDAGALIADALITYKVA
ncbi:MAG: hypothetical protein JWM69_1512 [Candidatus Binatus sp.]|jgi:uncharacterized protein (TIGR00369 family)|nr:hypothetical protein [Candidatus Binatus sp.]